MTGVETLSYEDLLPDTDRAWIDATLKKLEKVSLNCMAKAAPNKSIIGYSAGIDSSILAELLQRRRGETTLLNLGTIGSSDVKAARTDPLSNREGHHLIQENIGMQDIEEAARKVSGLVHVSNLSHFEDCVSFWLAARAAGKMKDIDYILSANGPDELFCGYDRFRRIVDEGGYPAVETEILTAIESAFKLKKQVSIVVSEFGLETREPFLEEEFRDFALKIPPQYKILKGSDQLRKRLWRCFGRALEIPDVTVVRQKKAMQYGMGIHPVVLSLVKKDRIDIMSDVD